ncbi:MAG TPA: 30S ribosomal protein S4 [Candidatus Limnocylindria bacterium]|jgi:small subunit ribosomal protein S4|nr:30S ribosomal protein S4 [Candidatus Limnocylindria bacterium]
MARYTDPVCRICRREGLKLFLKGSRCYSRKCSFERRSTPPGMNTQRRRKVSEFGLQLREKQKVRKSYSVLEKQFRNYFEKAEQRKGMTGENLLRMLEMRLDNVVYRMGLARSRAEARQLVSHGHFTVNGRPTNIPSFATKPGDRIEVRESRRGREYFKTASDTIKAAQIPDWVSVDAAKLSGSILAEPVREQMPLEFNEQLVVEFYSR